MGLDMYAYTLAAGSLDCEVNFSLKGREVQKLHYWRKHPDLHGWMEALYCEKGGAAESFNCEPLVLTLADLDRLEAALRNRGLPDTRGFFFGDSDGSEFEDDLDFIAKARAAIAEGQIVIYDSWW